MALFTMAQCGPSGNHRSTGEKIEKQHGLSCMHMARDVSDRLRYHYPLRRSNVNLEIVFGFRLAQG